MPIGHSWLDIEPNRIQGLAHHTTRSEGKRLGVKLLVRQGYSPREYVGVSQSVMEHSTHRPFARGYATYLGLSVKWALWAVWDCHPLINHRESPAIVPPRASFSIQNQIKTSPLNLLGSCNNISPVWDQHRWQWHDCQGWSETDNNLLGDVFGQCTS